MPPAHTHSFANFTTLHRFSIFHPSPLAYRNGCSNSPSLAGSMHICKSARLSFHEFLYVCCTHTHDTSFDLFKSDSGKASGDFSERPTRSSSKGGRRCARAGAEHHPKVSARNAGVGLLHHQAGRQETHCKAQEKLQHVKTPTYRQHEYMCKSEVALAAAWLDTILIATCGFVP